MLWVPSYPVKPASMKGKYFIHTHMTKLQVYSTETSIRKQPHKLFALIEPYPTTQSRTPNIMKISHLGAKTCVTGSCHLIQTNPG